METRDVVIVGAGPAGSSCAGRLYAAGLDVLVLDASTFPRHKPCAGWITPAALDMLALSPAEYGAGRTLQAFTGFRTGRIGGAWVETHYGSPVSFAVRRSELDGYLLRRSRARFRGGVPVTRLRRLGGTWIVNEEIRTPLLLGAGGHFCPVGRLFNGAARAETVVAAQELEFRMDARQQAACRVLPEVPQLYFSADLRGYGWCVRKGEYLNVGLGRKDVGRLKEHVRDFVAFLQGRKEIPSDLPSGWRGHAYALYEGTPRCLVDDGVLLLGDAAGLAAPATGEGIRPAIGSGLLAAATILDADGRYRREDLDPYRAAIEALLGPRRRRPGRPTRLVATLGGHLLGSRWFARHVVLDRGFLQPVRTPPTTGGASIIRPKAGRDEAGTPLGKAS